MHRLPILFTLGYLKFFYLPKPFILEYLGFLFRLFKLFKFKMHRLSRLFTLGYLSFLIYLSLLLSPT